MVQQTDRFESLSKLFNEAIIIVDRTGVVERSNAKAFELLGAHIAHRPLDVHMSRLRRALNRRADSAENRPDIIRTVRGAGYSLSRPST